MTVVTGRVSDVGLSGSTGTMWLQSGFRPTSTSLVAPVRRSWPITGGVLPDGVDVEPGPARMTIDVGVDARDSWDVTIPTEGPITLAGLVAQSYTWEPWVVDDVSAALEAVRTLAGQAQAARNGSEAARDGAVAARAGAESAAVDAAASKTAAAGSATAAAQKADAAAGSAAEADTAKTTASDKAGVATAAATTATQKAADAGRSADAAAGSATVATQKADVATGAADTAAQKADAAAGSAVAASLSASDAAASAAAAKLTWRGAWASGTSYQSNDAVSYGGSSWRAVRASTGVTPVEGTDWSLLAAKGAQGDVSMSQVADYVRSRSETLVTNGTGALKNNTNFSALTFKSNDAPMGAAGSFVCSTQQATVENDELIPVDPYQRYAYSYYARQTISGKSGAQHYGMVSCWDAYGQRIQNRHVMAQAGTTTTLAADLKAGDTTVKVSSAANWNNNAGASGYLRTIVFWNYVDPGGKAWPTGTYSRNVLFDAYPDGGISGTTITLKTAYSGATVPSGTPVSNGSSASDYLYCVPNIAIPEAWTRFWGTINAGIVPAGSAFSAATGFPAATAFVRVGWLANRTVTGGEQAFSLISLDVVQDPSQFATDTIPQDRITGLPTALAGKAPLASPALTGTPTAPTAASGTNTTQIATTAFVAGAAASKADLVGGKVPQSQIPAVAMTDFLGAVGSEAAMLALSGQRGDWATRTDKGTDWQLIADDPAQVSSWREMTYPPSPVSSVAGRTGAVTLSKTDVGLGNVDNTADVDKPISAATASALAGKVAALGATSGLWAGTQAQYDALPAETKNAAGFVAVIY